MHIGSSTNVFMLDLLNEVESKIESSPVSIERDDGIKIKICCLQTT